jgi:hypothetical protein
METRSRRTPPRSACICVQHEPMNPKLQTYPDKGSRDREREREGHGERPLDGIRIIRDPLNHHPD